MSVDIVCTSIKNWESGCWARPSSPETAPALSVVK